MESRSDGHRWRFFRAGGVDQVRIESGADLRALDSLDLKNWVALSCPVNGLEFDERTLALLDRDGDARIRAPEIQEAVRWTCTVLKNPDVVFRAKDLLELKWLDDANPAGALVLSTARRILSNAGRAGQDAISIPEAMAATDELAKSAFNGDGIVPPGAIDDADLKTVAESILACMGGETDRSGEPGISAAKVDGFFDELAAYAAWQLAAIQDAGSVLPLGDETAGAYAAVQAVAVKIEDYFARCRLAAFDNRATALMNRSEEDFKALASDVLFSGAAQIAAFPLAHIEPDRPLPLGTGLNPAWVGAMSEFLTRAVKPILGEGTAELDPDGWARLQERLAPYGAWLAAKAGAAVESIGLERAREILESDARQRLHDRIAQDLALEPQMQAILDVERLVRLVRDLPVLLQNYVSFSRFYGMGEKATFQAGTLYIDARACSLCLKVHDPGKHGLLAGLSRMYLVYCDCTRPSGERMSIVAAVTNGHGDNLMVGRNGVFYDRAGRDWDATITRIVDNPISLRQAVFAPYKKFLRMIEEQVAKRAAAADQASDARMAGAAEATASADKAKTPAQPKKIDIGTLAAIGVAVGGITAAIGALLAGFFGLGMWMPLGVIGIFVLISGPSVLITWLKLRQRNIGPVLDASGWAVNALAKVNTPFGASLTTVAAIPKGAERSMSDPYKSKSRVWIWVVGILLVLGAAAFILHKTGTLGEWFGYGEEPVAEVAVPAADEPAQAE